MKAAKKIITEHFVKPSKKLRDLICIKEIISQFPKVLVDSVLYSNIKNKTLIIYVTSAAFKQEFDQKKPLIKSLASMLGRAKEECRDLEFENIKVYFEFRPKVEEKEPHYVLVFDERAEGDFENLAKSSEVAKKIEEIRSVIKERRCN